MFKKQKPTKFLPLLLPYHWPFWLFIGILRILVLLPYRWQLAIGRCLGLLAYSITKKARSTTDVNLKLCFPELSDNERQQLAKDSFASVGMGIFEIAMSWWASNKRLLPLKKHVEGHDHYQQAQNLNKGVILLGTHMSTFAIAGRLLATEYDFAVVYRRQKIPVLDYIAMRAYHKHFYQAIVREDTRKMVKTLQAKIPIWITPDIDPAHKASIFVPFFNVQADTVIIPARFSELANAVILPVAHYRRPQGDGYDLIGHPLMLDIPSGDIERDTHAVNIMIEKIIRHAPEQYLWQYKRFRTRPEGEINPYKQAELSQV